MKRKTALILFSILFIIIGVIGWIQPLFVTDILFVISMLFLFVVGVIAIFRMFLNKN